VLIGRWVREELRVERPDKAPMLGRLLAVFGRDASDSHESFRLGLTIKRSIVALAPEVCSA
jgi:hypothetical protein